MGSFTTTDAVLRLGTGHHHIRGIHLRSAVVFRAGAVVAPQALARRGGVAPPEVTVQLASGREGDPIGIVIVK